MPDDTGRSGGLSEKRVISFTPLPAAERTDEEEPMEISKKSVFVGLLLAVFGGSTAIAQDGQNRATEYEEIIVTALKRETTLQETPLAVSVLSGGYLVDAGVQDLGDLQQIAPSLHMDESPFGVNINIRGVTTTDNTSKGDQGVGFNIDGITVGRPREMIVAFMDVERVEVLRGPQGTLYGKSTTGGVINVISKRPSTDEFSGEARMELGSYDTQRLFAAFNLPLSDNFAVRLAAQDNQREGYWKANITDFSTTAEARQDEDNRSYRLAALWDINDRHSIYLSATDTKLRGVGGGNIPNAIFYSGGRNVVGVPDGVAPKLNDDFTSTTLEYTGHFGGVEVTYLGGRREYDADSFSIDPAFPESGGGDHWAWNNYIGTGKTTQHELRFENTEPGRFNWVFGYNDFKEELTESDHNWNNFDVDRPDRRDAENAFNAANATTHESSGFFGHVDFAVTDKLNLTAAARRSEDSVVRFGELGFGSGAPPVQPGNCQFPDSCTFIPNDASQKADKTTWRVGFDVNLSENTMLYGYAATGYKAGGFNDLDPLNPPNSGVYEPEELIDYEIGYKGNITNNVVWNSNLFFYDYKKLQLSNVENIGNIGTILFTVSVPAEVKGWENELIWTPTDRDTLNINLTTLDGQFTQWNNPPDYLAGTSFVALEGEPINKVSDLTASVDWSHDFDLASGARLTTRLYSRYEGGYPVNNYYSGDDFEVDSYTRSDANITYHSADGRYSVGAFIENIEDDLQFRDTPNNSDPTTMEDGIAASAPRTTGMRFSVQF